MNIAICDDDIVQLDIIETALNQIKLWDSYTINRFLSGEEFISSLKNNTVYDLVFLDIQMSGINGLETYKQAIKYDVMSNVPVIFVSTHIEHLPDVFGFKIPVFLVKPFSSSTLIRTITEVLSRYKNIKIFSRSINGIEERFLINDIYYFKSEDHYTRAITLNKNLLIREDIKNIENELFSYGFFRCHRSYLINLLHVKSWNNNEITIQLNGCMDRIPVSKKRYAAFKEAMLHFKSEEFYSV